MSSNVERSRSITSLLPHSKYDIFSLLHLAFSSEPARRQVSDVALRCSQLISKDHQGRYVAVGFGLADSALPDKPQTLDDLLSRDSPSATIMQSSRGRGNSSRRVSLNDRCDQMAHYHVSSMREDGGKGERAKAFLPLPYPDPLAVQKTINKSAKASMKKHAVESDGLWKDSLSSPSAPASRPLLSSDEFTEYFSCSRKDRVAPLDITSQLSEVIDRARPRPVRSLLDGFPFSVTEPQPADLRSQPELIFKPTPLGEYEVERTAFMPLPADPPSRNGANPFARFGYRPR